MNQRTVLLAVAGVVAVGAAFGGGYYLSRPPSPPPAVTQPNAAPAPAPVADLSPPPTSAAEQATPSSPAASAPAARKPAPRRRYADYANGEGDYSAPPPPPPASDESWHQRPDPFAGRFATFPMRHAGDGTAAAPLTWSAVTEFGDGHEADLRIAILVPEPAADDRGGFWQAWGGRRDDNLIPEMTHGTPVIVTGSASVVLAVDPDIVDLDAPALLIVHGDMGRLVYRSRDVAPARGEAWDSRGARWIFAPDANFYRTLRDGGSVSFEVHSRIADRDVRVPFESEDFGPSAREFERSLSYRLASIEDRWQRASGGRPPPPAPSAPPPPPTVTHPAPVIVPSPPTTPAGGPADHGHRWPPGQTAETPPPTTAPAPPPAAPPSATTPPPAQWGGAQDHGAHGPRHAGGPPPAGTPTSSTPTPPPPQATPPAKSVAAQTTPPATPPGPPPAKHESAPVTPPAKSAAAQTTPPATPPAKHEPAPTTTPPAQTQVASAKPAPAPVSATPPKSTPPANGAEAVVAAYRPPADQCGPRPDYSTAGLDAGTPAELARAQQTYAEKGKWIGCRTTWMKSYDTTFASLEQNVATQSLTLATVPGGAAVAQAHDVAKRGYDADVAQWSHYTQSYRTALMKARTTRPQASPETGRSPIRP